jgi:hypothetical protein
MVRRLLSDARAVVQASRRETPSAVGCGQLIERSPLRPEVERADDVGPRQWTRVGSVLDRSGVYASDPIAHRQDFRLAGKDFLHEHAVNLVVRIAARVCQHNEIEIPIGSVAHG